MKVSYRSFSERISSAKQGQQASQVIGKMMKVSDICVLAKDTSFYFSPKK